MSWNNEVDKCSFGVFCRRLRSLNQSGSIIIVRKEADKVPQREKPLIKTTNEVKR